MRWEEKLSKYQIFFSEFICIMYAYNSYDWRFVCFSKLLWIERKTEDVVTSSLKFTAQDSD